MLDMSKYSNNEVKDNEVMVNGMSFKCSDDDAKVIMAILTGRPADFTTTNAHHQAAPVKRNNAKTTTKTKKHYEHKTEGYEVTFSCVPQKSGKKITGYAVTFTGLKGERIPTDVYQFLKAQTTVDYNKTLKGFIFPTKKQADDFMSHTHITVEQRNAIVDGWNKE